MQNLIIGADYRTFKHILECCMTTKQAISALSRTCPAQEFKFLLLRHAEPGADTRSAPFLIPESGRTRQSPASFLAHGSGQRPEFDS